MDENRLFGVWENALLLSLQLEQTSQEAHQSLEELASLVVSLGARVADRIIQNRPQIHPAYFFGTGKLSQIKEVLHQKCADAVIVDASLTPKQTRNLEQKWKRPVLDRTQVILEIFARNARTREAKLQIELAQAEFLMPRLAGLWKHLDRERGGIGVSRGGGEKQIENDRQYLRRRISKLRDEIKRIEKERNTQKKRRVQCLNVSLVGYTNAGKSTVMNRLTDSHVLVENRLFATLDSTTR
ncbi:MAG: GTPase HflX, partial [SAR324 cluster bacterium]|nr:GTPase HflX [SAR324 cluster bacterium]